MHKFFLSIAALGFLFSCSNSQQSQIAKPGGNLPPVETQAPNSPQYKPAFAGQTRIAGVKTQTAIDVQVISTALTKPWAVVPLPDGRLLITEKRGNFKIASANGTLSDAITGIPKVDDSGQGGLLDVALDPDF